MKLNQPIPKLNVYLFLWEGVVTQKVVTIKMENLYRLRLSKCLISDPNIDNFSQKI